jgi:hypothetical protein
MRKATRGDWAAHAPATNCMWLAYLADTLLARKRVPLDAAAKRALRAFRCGLPCRARAVRHFRGPLAVQLQGPCNLKGLSIQGQQVCQKPSSAARLKMHACGHPCQLPCTQPMSSALCTHKHACRAPCSPLSSHVRPSWQTLVQQPSDLLKQHTQLVRCCHVWLSCQPAARPFRQEAGAGMHKLPGPDPGRAVPGHVAGRQRLACLVCVHAFYIPFVTSILGFLTF